jgi:hypothetical protein
MKCPKCSEEMINGKYKLNGTILGFMLFGLSQKELCFISEEYDDKITLGLSETKKGYFCDNCHTQVILNEESYEI